jgi:hypothetical protein
MTAAGESNVSHLEIADLLETIELCFGALTGKTFAGHPKGPQGAIDEAISRSHGILTKYVDTNIRRTMAKRRAGYKKKGVTRHYTLSEACEVIGCGEQWMRSLCQSGRGHPPFVRLGDGVAPRYRFEVNAFHRWVLDNTHRSKRGRKPRLKRFSEEAPVETPKQEETNVEDN